MGSITSIMGFEALLTFGEVKVLVHRSKISNVGKTGNTISLRKGKKWKLKSSKLMK